jgi:hypothetical protein
VALVLPHCHVSFGLTGRSGVLAQRWRKFGEGGEKKARAVKVWDFPSALDIPSKKKIFDNNHFRRRVRIS